MTRTAVDFDPYKVWLNIRTEQRPLNAYQLLGLSQLETDQSRIRMAITRQRSLMELKQLTADPGLFRQISAELEEAIVTLLDPERRAVLEGSIKRQMALAGPKPKTNEMGNPVAAPGMVVCKQCQRENAQTRRFCVGCGETLWEKCTNCGTEVSSNERFCGDCGQDVRGAVDTKLAEMAQRFADAQGLAEQHEYARALSSLRVLAAIDDRRFSHWAEKGVAEIERIKTVWQTQQETVQAAFAKAKKYNDRHSYEKAQAKLIDIPAPMRTPEIVQLLEQVTSSRNELLSLGGEIREALKEDRIWDMFPKIERLLALKPDHPQALPLSEQIRARLVRRAKKRLAERKYPEVLEILSHIPEFATSAEVKDLIEIAEELSCLRNHVRLAPVVDKSLLNLGKRLGELDETDDEIKQLLDRMKRTSKTAPADPRLAAPPWSAASRKSPLGLPVEWLGHFTRVTTTDEVAKKLLEEHPGEFFQALGLAVQGIGEAVIPLNLLPPEKVSVWGRLASTFSRKEARAAWGIDLGEQALKAIRLTVEPKSQTITLAAVEYIPHSRPLSAAEGEMERIEILTETLKALRAKIDPDKHQICAALPGMQVLGRFFELPPIPLKKVPDTVQYELNHQVPIEASELSWAYHTRADKENKKDEAVARRVTLVAARKTHVAARSVLFSAAGFELDVIQSDCLALHNAMVFEFFPEVVGETIAANSKGTDSKPGGSTPAGSKGPSSSSGAGIASGEAMATLDVGTAGTNVVISTPHEVWFRSFGIGGESYLNATSRALQLTGEQANILLRKPYRGRRLAPLEEAIAPLWAQMTSEVERSLTTFRKAMAGIPVKRIFGLGGGIATHGLLRYFTHGK